MQGGSERHLSSNKYNVEVLPSSSPNRRLLVAILVVITLVVVVVLLGALIPTHMKGKEKNGSSKEKEIEQQRGKDFKVNITTRSEVTLHSKGRPTASPDFYSSPSQSQPEISATSGPRSSSSTPDISLRLTSSLMISHLSSSAQEDKSSLPSASASVSGEIISRASESLAGLKTSVSSSPDFEKASARVASAASHLHNIPVSTAQTTVTLSLENQGKDKSYLAISSASASGKIISRATESLAGLKTLVSSSPDFEKASATVPSAALDLHNTPVSTAQTIVTLSLENQGKDKSYLAFSSASASGEMIRRASEFLAELKKSVSSSPDFGKASATAALAALHLHGTPVSTAETAVTSSLENQVTTLSLMSPKTIPSTSATLRQDRPFSLASTGSFDTVAFRNSVSPIISSMSEVRSTSRVADLRVIANLKPNTESKWSRWSSWSDCTKTCGSGTRYRHRICVAINQDNREEVFAPISCAGKSSQTGSCAVLSCPDCSRNCTTGTLNAACDACTCDHLVLTGRVFTVDNAALSEANISLAQTPYNILAQTNASGHFMTLGVCVDEQELLLQKPGFVPVTKKANVLTSTTASITGKLEFAVPPFVTVHPESKLRMPGQAVTFCCDGQGNPPPEIEWFKENNIIDKEIYSYNNTLVITAYQGLSGSYRCRVVNNFGSEFSNSDTLKILGEDVDSCSPTPSSKNITLPEGCVVDAAGDSFLDVGECKPVACLKNDSLFNSSCQDPTFCCGPGDTMNVLVNCKGVVSFNISKVTSCSCGSCSEQATLLRGIVVGGPEEEPMRYGDVIYEDKIVAYTDGNGRFPSKFLEKLRELWLPLRIRTTKNSRRGPRFIFSMKEVLAL